MPTAVAQSDYDLAVRAHAEHYSRLLAENSPLLLGSGSPDHGAGQLAALHRLSFEHDNLLEALDTALKRGMLDCLHCLAHHLRPYLDITSDFPHLRRCYELLLAGAAEHGDDRLTLLAQFGLAQSLGRLGIYEGATSVSQAACQLAAAQGERDIEANCRLGLGNIELMHDNYGAAREHYAAALELCRHPDAQRSAASVLNALGNLEYLRDNLAAAWDFNHEALVLSRAVGNRYREANTLNSLGKIEFGRGNLDSAARLLEEALAIRRSLHDMHGMSGSLNNLGILAFTRGDHDAALALLHESAGLAHDLGNEYGEANALSNAARCELLRGNLDLATEAYRRALPLLLRIGDKTGIIVACACAGSLLSAFRCYEAATLTLHSSLANAAALGYEIEFDDRPAVEAGHARLAAALDSGAISAEQLVQWQSAGEAMSLEELTQFALDALDRVAGTADSTH
jgi:tetratricopeptide (TPR) repeat protein